MRNTCGLGEELELFEVDARKKGYYFNSGNWLTVERYTDIDYAGSLVDERSTVGYCIFLERNLVSLRSKKHDKVAWSNAEAEFYAMALGNLYFCGRRLLLITLKLLGLDQWNCFVTTNLQSTLHINLCDMIGLNMST